MITDSHAHLYWNSFDEDRDRVLARARAAGVERIVVPGTDVATSRAALDLAASQEGVFAAAGVHPHAAEGFDDSVRDEIEAMCRRPDCVAVGESGLDWFRNYSPRRDQLDCFHWHLDLARRIDKPLIIHCRAAFEDTARILPEYRGVRGVMHCYAFGTVELEPFLAADLYISFAGAVTYPKNEENRKAARAVPIERLLVETDAPFLSPHAHRGKRNEPAHTKLVVDCLAAERGMSASALARVTSENAARLFGLPAVS